MRTTEEAAINAIGKLLELIDENPSREGLTRTPERYVRAMDEMTSGRGVDIAALLAVQFDVQCDEMVVCRNISFVSVCEHHLLPFTGVAAVAYIPRGNRVVGLSKLARLVHAFAKRLQVQERMTTQIANALMKHLDPLGVGVVVRAQHSCMRCRGVKQADAEMVTSALLGQFREAEVRAEFLNLATR